MKVFEVGGAKALRPTNVIGVWEWVAIGFLWGSWGGDLTQTIGRKVVLG